MKKWRWNRMRGAGDGVKSAQRELERSERRLNESQPLRRSFTEMMEENHVQAVIGEWVRKQRGEGQGDGRTAPG